jgi:hypothetical protein
MINKLYKVMIIISFLVVKNCFLMKILDIKVILKKFISKS